MRFKAEHLWLLVLASHVGCADPKALDESSEEASIALSADEIHKLTGWSKFSVRVAEMPEGKAIVIVPDPSPYDGHRSFFIAADGSIDERSVP